MKYLHAINVNDLINILNKYYKTKDIFIESAEVANVWRQHTPQFIDIGIGGVLSIEFTTSKKLKNV